MRAVHYVKQASKLGFTPVLRERDRGLRTGGKNDGNPVGIYFARRAVYKHMKTRQTGLWLLSDKIQVRDIYN